ncbi:histidine kinase [Geothermobacter hydrogeniphilus]|uniref:histidine kinase n=1 Tax=Geothermobacter hydrogeniphilus TaxID=1969733 RepID=A0A2K2H8V1_9BACT|nr:ATP-binding protein [Geothermobacter hydrogeniphilus]PNU19663.1 histidine kinase [Geothermobacter hydrogeniphilus]
MIFNSLVIRVIILNILLVAVVIGTFTMFHIRREEQHLIQSTRESAKLLLTTVEKSIFNSMRVGNSYDVQAILEMVGRSHRLTNVRIFHPDGTILKSARPDEIGRQIDSFDLNLYQNNRSEGVFKTDGGEVLGMVKPIVSDERCFICHGYGRKVVGVLNLNFSLNEMTGQIWESYQFFMLHMVVSIVILSAGTSFLLLRFVKRPIETMAETMAKVEEGDLSVRLEPKYADEMGSLVRSFNSMVDNLQKAQAELEEYHYQQMQRADRLASVGEMATGLAHEIKNPLAGISGAISVLAEDFPESDPRREVVDQVLAQIARLNKTVTDLLYFGRPGKPEFSWVDINGLIKETLFFVGQHPEARNIHRVKEFARDLPPAWADVKQIQQVFFNIIINAIQAMEEGGTLTVQTSRVINAAGTDVLRVEISDTGPGIAPSALERIFVPFFTTKNQGTGLGLPICKQLVEQHGGMLKVVSKIGEGSTFIIEIPVQQHPSFESKEEPRVET